MIANVRYTTCATPRSSMGIVPSQPDVHLHQYCINTRTASAPTLHWRYDATQNTKPHVFASNHCTPATVPTSHSQHTCTLAASSSPSVTPRQRYLLLSASTIAFSTKQWCSYCSASFETFAPRWLAGMSASRDCCRGMNGSYFSPMCRRLDRLGCAALTA